MIKKVIIILTLTIFCLGVYVLSIKANEKPKFVKIEISKIKNQKYTKEEIETNKKFFDYIKNYKIIEVEDIDESKIENLDNDSYYKKYVLQNEKQLSETKSLILGKNIIFTDAKTIEENYPSYKTLDQANKWIIAEQLKLIRDGKINEFKKDFSKYNDARKRQLLGSNMFVNALVFSDYLEYDLNLAQYVLKKYNIKLDIKNLKKEKDSLIALFICNHFKNLKLEK